jgi:hypothetical protein
MIVLVGREREWWAKAQTHLLRLARTLSYLSWAIDGGEEPIDPVRNFLAPGHVWAPFRRRPAG